MVVMVVPIALMAPGLALVLDMHVLEAELFGQRRRVTAAYQLAEPWRGACSLQCLGKDIG